MGRVELLRDGQPIALSALPLSLLAYLIRHRERVVGREELIAVVWRGVKVSEGSMRQAVFELRHALEDAGDEQRFVRTVRGHGYRFVGELAEQTAITAGLGQERRAASACFGREQELARLRNTLGEATQGSGRVVVIVGPPGIGKSRLVHELLHEARLRKVSCVVGHAHTSGFAPPFWPWLELLRAYFERCSEEQSARYRELSPRACHLLRGADKEAHERNKPLSALPAQDRFELLEELAQLLTSFACDFPGALVLEDAQWADEASVALLDHLIRRVPETASLLLVTCRQLPARENRALARVLAGVTRGAAGERLQLEALAPEATRAMIEAHLQRDVAPSLCADVQALSRGNPLFALELARLLARSEQSSSDKLLPDQLEMQEVIRTRLLALPEPAQQTVRCACVLGPVFALAQLAYALEQAPDVALAGLDLCIEHGIIVDAGQATHFSFSHALLRETAYASLPNAERAPLHLRAGIWLEERSGGSSASELNVLAHHFFVAAPCGGARKAVQYALRSAELACVATAYGDALEHYQRALSCGDLEPAISGAERLDIELLRGQALRASGAEATGVNQTFLTLAERAERLGDARLFARAVLGYAGQHPTGFIAPRFVTSPDSDQRPLIERALAALPQANDELHVLLLCALAWTLLYSTDRQLRERVVAEMLERARALQSPVLLVRALVTRIYLCASPGTERLRLSACDELVELTYRHGLKGQEVEALVTRCVCLLGLGERAAAERDAERAQQLAALQKHPLTKLRAQVPPLLLAFCEGDLAQAEQLTCSIAAATSQDLLQRAQFMVRMSCLKSLTEGPSRTQLEMFENLLASFPDLIGARCILANLYAQFGMLQEAERSFDWAAQDDFRLLPEDLHWLSEMAQLASAAVALGDARRAALVYRRLRPHAEVFDFYAAEACPAGPISFWLADLAMTMGDYAEAQRWLERADALNTRLRAALFTQLTTLARAKLILLSRPHEAERARALLHAVSNFAARIGAKWILTLVEQLERDHGIQVQPARDGVPQLRAVR